MKTRHHGFTILELLVAMAVLALLLVAVLEITGKTTTLTRMAGSKLNATQAVRSALDAVERDLQNAVVTPEATVLVRTLNGSPIIALLTRGRGPGTQPARFLAVSYEWSPDGSFKRGYVPVNWAASNLLAAAESAASAPDQPQLAGSLLQVSYIALLTDGTRQSLATPAPGPWNASGTVTYGQWSVPTGWTALVSTTKTLAGNGPRVRAVLVAMVGTDPKGFALLSSAQKALFTQPTGADPVADWEAVANSASLPGPVRSSLSIQSKTIPLP